MGFERLNSYSSLTLKKNKKLKKKLKLKVRVKFMVWLVQETCSSAATTYT